MKKKPGKVVDLMDALRQMLATLPERDGHRRSNVRVYTNEPLTDSHCTAALIVNPGESTTEVTFSLEGMEFVSLTPESITLRFEGLQERVGLWLACDFIAKKLKASLELETDLKAP